MKKTLARAAFAGTLAFGAGCGLFAALWAATGAAWAKTCAITCGMFLYHLAIRVIGPLAVRVLSPKAPFDPMGPWFRPRAWEAPLYRDVSGTLYVLPARRDRDAVRKEGSVRAESVSETAWTVEVTVDLLDGPGGQVTGVEYYAFPYELEEDRWVFTDFRMID